MNLFLILLSIFFDLLKLIILAIGVVVFVTCKSAFKVLHGCMTRVFPFLAVLFCVAIDLLAQWSTGTAWPAVCQFWNNSNVHIIQPRVAKDDGYKKQKEQTPRKLRTAKFAKNSRVAYYDKDLCRTVYGNVVQVSICPYGGETYYDIRYGNKEKNTLETRLSWP